LPGHCSRTDCGALPAAETWQLFSELDFSLIFSNLFSKGIGYRVGLGFRVGFRVDSLKEIGFLALEGVGKNWEKSVFGKLLLPPPRPVVTAW
jgi:hypothetical protein